MDDDYFEYIDDVPCPKCGNAETKSRACTQLGCDDGSVDVFEDDPINNSPGDFEICRECHGTGSEWWCPKCGHDMNTPTQTNLPAVQIRTQEGGATESGAQPTDKNEPGCGTPGATTGRDA
jgi:hypothetical protein